MASRKVWGLKDAGVTYEQEQLQLLLLFLVEFWNVSSLNKMCTEQKGKSKRMVVDLDVRELLGWGKKTHKELL